MLLTHEQTKALIQSARDHLAIGEVSMAYHYLLQIDSSREAELTIEAGDPFEAIEERFKRYEKLYLC